MDAAPIVAPGRPRPSAGPQDLLSCIVRMGVYACAVTLDLSGEDTNDDADDPAS